MTRFADAALGFSMEIPEGWMLLPSPWASNLMRSASATSVELAEMLKKASAPFLYGYLPQSDPAAAIPTVQCTAKPISVLGMVGGVQGIIDIAIPQLQAAFADLDIVERQDLCIVAGARSAYLRANMSVKNEAHATFLCTSELYVLQGSRAAFMLGLSGPAAAELRPVAAFGAMLRSLRLA